MATVAIILLIVIIIYTLYAIFWDKPKNQPSVPVQRKTSQKAVEAKKQAKAPQPAKEAEKSSKAPPAEEQAELPSELVNPKTGERASLPNNYRFAKRWIKEALVEEGLLPKIYKNNELDDAANKKIKKALSQLATSKKYQD